MYVRVPAGVSVCVCMYMYVCACTYICFVCTHMHACLLECAYNQTVVLIDEVSNLKLICNILVFLNIHFLCAVELYDVN